MKLTVPTNWDDNLIPSLEKPGVRSVYGKFSSDFFGGGRPSYILKKLSHKQVSNHIKLIQDADLEFEYLLNSACMGNREWTKKGNRKLRKFLDYLVKLGVNRVVVASPYIAQVVMEDYGPLKISVSCFANVNSLSKALFWEDLGADRITLSPVESNRDFKLIRSLTKSLKAEVQLIANNNCLNHCPLYYTHNNFGSHASSSDSMHSGFDYCRILCRKLMTEDPVRALSAPWIRPEDLKIYADLGVKNIKLVDRIMSTEALDKIVEAYSSEKYSGNLYDLFTDNPENVGHDHLGLFHKLKHFFHPSRVNLIRLYNMLKERDELSGTEYYLDNSKLDGFLEHFLENDCRNINCKTCEWCETWVKDALRPLPKVGSTNELNTKFLEEIISGRIFK